MDHQADTCEYCNDPLESPFEKAMGYHRECPPEYPARIEK